MSESQGVLLIAAERERQVAVEGWTPEHDDLHDNFQLSRAASGYAILANGGKSSRPPVGWPWEYCWWKPSDDPVRNLVKAGALIAAEIDRLERAKETEEPAHSSGTFGLYDGLPSGTAAEYLADVQTRAKWGKE